MAQQAVMAMGPDYGAGDCTWRRNACPQHKHRDGARGYYTNHRDSRWDGARERGEERGGGGGEERGGEGKSGGGIGEMQMILSFVM